MSLTIKGIISNLWTDIKTYISQNYQPKGSYANSDHNHNSAYLGISAKAESAKVQIVLHGGGYLVNPVPLHLLVILTMIDTIPNQKLTLS